MLRWSRSGAEAAAATAQAIERAFATVLGRHIWPCTLSNGSAKYAERMVRLKDRKKKKSVTVCTIQN